MTRHALGLSACSTPLFPTQKNSAVNESPCELGTGHRAVCEARRWAAASPIAWRARAARSYIGSAVLGTSGVWPSALGIGTAVRDLTQVLL